MNLLKLKVLETAKRVAALEQVIFASAIANVSTDPEKKVANRAQQIIDQDRLQYERSLYNLAFSEWQAAGFPEDEGTATITHAVLFDATPRYRYHLFVGRVYYPGQGLQDYVGSYEDRESAEEAWALHEQYGEAHWWHMIIMTAPDGSLKYPEDGDD